MSTYMHLRPSNKSDPQPPPKVLRPADLEQRVADALTVVNEHLLPPEKTRDLKVPRHAAADVENMKVAWAMRLAADALAEDIWESVRIPWDKLQRRLAPELRHGMHRLNQPDTTNTPTPMTSMESTAPDVLRILTHMARVVRKGDDPEYSE